MTDATATLPGRHWHTVKEIIAARRSNGNVDPERQVPREILNDLLDLAVTAGETMALVGESGSGKSVTSKSIIRLMPSGDGRIAAGRMRFTGKEVATRNRATLNQVGRSGR